MISKTVGFILIINITLAVSDNTLRSTDFILCRSCGSDLTSSNYIISKFSPSSSFSFRDTLFTKDEVLVQVFSTDFIFQYPIVTFLHTICVEAGEWEELTSWFPGYRWKPCVCSECGAYIGFVFEPIDPAVVEPSKPFYGLILTTVVSENFINTLTHYPIES